MDKKTGRGARPQDDESVAMRAAYEAWHREWSQRVVGEVIRHRDLKNLSNDELRLRLDRLGWRLTRDSLAGILAGKRKTMPFADVLLFAQALNVPPAHLLVPAYTNARVKVWPDDPESPHAHRVIRWIAGLDGEVGGSYVASPTAVVDDYYEYADLSTLIAEGDQSLKQAEYAVQMARGSDVSEDVRARMLERARRDLEDVVEVRQRVRNLWPAAELPDLPRELAFLDTPGLRSVPPIDSLAWSPPPHRLEQAPDDGDGGDGND